MGLRITTNVAALNTHRSLSGSERVLSRSLERLSSGLRINRAADDAAGLSISEVLRSQVRGALQAARNIRDGLSMLGVADGAVNEITAMVQRMRELAVQAANGTYTDGDRAALQAEFLALQAEITNTATNTTFGELFPLLGVGSGNATTAKTTNANLFPAESFNVVNAAQTFAVTGATTAVTLGADAATYNLGAAGASIRVQAYEGTTLSRTLTYGADYTYDVATRQIQLTASGMAAGLEDRLRVDYIRQDSLSATLASPPLPGSETVRIGATTLTAGADYTIAGSTITLTGAGRPAAGAGATVRVGYVPPGTTTVNLDVSNPFSPVGATSMGPITFRIGAPTATTLVGFTEGVDYTLVRSQSDAAGQTPLFAYQAVFDNAVLAAAAPPHVTGTVQLRASYAIDAPTFVGPLLVDIQSGANNGETTRLTLERVSLATLGLASASVGTQADAGSALTALDGAIAFLAGVRSRYGADENRLQHALANVNQQALQMQSAFSRLRDTDMAQETSTLTRQQILFGSGAAMLREANIQPRTVLALLSG